jgi:hypothetical protein
MAFFLLKFLTTLVKFCKRLSFFLFKWLLKLFRFDFFINKQESSKVNFKVYGFDFLSFNFKNKLTNYFSSFELSNKFMLVCCALALNRISGKTDLFLNKFLSNISSLKKNKQDSSVSDTSLGKKSLQFNVSKKFNHQLVNNSILQKSYENRSVFFSARNTFNLRKNSKVAIDSIIFNNNLSVSKYLTSDGKLNLNFHALEDFKTYLILLDPSFLPQRKLKKRIKKKSNTNGINFERLLINSKIAKNTFMRTRGLLDQINFLLMHRHSILKGDIRLENLNLSKEIKDVLFSYTSTIGPYGADTTFYSSDLFSTDRLNVVRRVSLFYMEEKPKNINLFKNKIGFLNFGTNFHEEFELVSDTSFGGFFSGKSFSINPLIVFGLILYSVCELFVIFYFMADVLGSPFQTINFFFKYPLVYFYENLSGFPSANYFFFSLCFWFMVFIMFSNYFLELLDEERFNPPKLSWLFNFLKEFAYDFVFLGCIFFCVIETVVFFDLLFTRFFFIGTPGYPQIFTSLFLLLYDIFFVIGTTNYFSLYLDSFVFFDIKFPVFYFSDFVPFLKRYPLVQPVHLVSSFCRPNFFLWAFDSFFSYFFLQETKSTFSLENSRLVLQREIVQDIRKYNYLRKYLVDLSLLGQIFSRGFNGFDYRLDLKYVNNPIIATEQLMRFDWRFKSSHFDGLNSRLFRPDLFGSSQRRSYPLFKKIHFFKHKTQAYSSRYGYFEYLNSPSQSSVWLNAEEEVDERDDYQDFLLSKTSFLSKIPNNQREYYRFHFNKTRRVKFGKNDRRFSFLFSPADFKFFKMKELNQIIPSKSRRNFRNSMLLLNFWSYLGGNTKPRMPFKYRSFIPLDSFSQIPFESYLTARLEINEMYFRPRSFFQEWNLQRIPLNRKQFRDAFLKDPHALFHNSFFRFADNTNSKELNSNLKDSFSRQTLSAQPKFLSKSQLVSTGLLNKQKTDNSKINGLISKKIQPVLKNTKIALPFKELPNYPYNLNTRKYNSISWFFLNGKPSYYLRPTSIFTTYCQIDLSFNKEISKYSFLFYDYPVLSNSGLLYPLSLFFFGFGKLSTANLRLFSFDNYYAQNHNFFRSVLDFFFKNNQFLTIPNKIGRFQSVKNGGIKHSLDFMFPMISELRMKEKLIPLNFSYDVSKILYWNHSDSDPYANIRDSKFSKSPCYFLDSRIQNWFFYQNVIWNDYYHFFFRRSFQTEGNGSKFCLASFNPLNGPQSYKIFLNNSTLEFSRIGQYFYNYIPWLQYKFKWLLYPTSTYKRFDSLRFIQQHSSRKFYFSSLLKFYQVNMFRWQQAATLFSYNQSQFRNFFLHLFFHKYKLLSDLKSLRNLLLIVFEKLENFDSLNLFFLAKINVFNFVFFNSMENINYFRSFTIPLKGVASEHSQQYEYELFLPFFTEFDFKFFQHAMDFRRWKSLQTNYLRDWKFENYTKYLGPLVYKHDIASLMGFFAPFEYRNQIFVSKLRKDSLRFSIFFPKKIIAEENLFLSNPRFSKQFLRKRKLQHSVFPSLYSFILNKPFLNNVSNYSYFLDDKFTQRHKLFLRGLHSHLQRINLNSKLNLNTGLGFSELLFAKFNKIFTDISYGFSTFSDFNSKKKRLVTDKIFWLSRTQEIKQVGLDAKKFLFSKRDSFFNKIDISTFSLSKLTSQLGNSIDVIIPVLPPKLEFFKNKPIFLNSSMFSFKNQFIDFKKLTKNIEIMSFLNPNIYLTFGGPKALSTRWHSGQSWLKFVIASQNSSTRPFHSFYGYGQTQMKKRRGVHLPDKAIYELERQSALSNFKTNKTILFENNPKKTLPQINGFGSFISPSLNGKTVAPPFLIPETSGYFNFGLSGIGRLPRLSRSFFHALFSRNKLESFAELKKNYLKLYLSSIPLFQNTAFGNNFSFSVFWKLVMNSNYFFFFDTFRYNVFFWFICQI